MSIEGLQSIDEEYIKEVKSLVQMNPKLKNENFPDLVKDIGQVFH